MYGGAILDLFNLALRNFVEQPDKLYSPALAREYVGNAQNFERTCTNKYLFKSLPSEVQMICQLSKIFALHFDRVCELPYNKSVFYSGSKMLDILDCASQAKRTVIHESCLGNYVVLKASILLYSLFKNKTIFELHF